MNWVLDYTILLPALIGTLFLFVPNKLKTIKGIAAFIVSIIVFYYTFQVFKLKNGIVIPYNNKILSEFLVFNIDSLSKLVALFIGFFGVVISLYSIKFVKSKESFKGYYGKFLLTLAASVGAVLSDHLILFTFFWGFLGITLYRFLRGNCKNSAAAAKKSLIMIGASDSILIMGIGFLVLKTNSFLMSNMHLELTGAVVIIGFLSLLIASLTKAGAFPVHTWLPDYADTAPASVSAFIPASLDKLLGIYFLARICMNIFILNNWATLMLVIIGSVTIIAAVMMALIQHNYKKLLGYHAVSQVGYMVTGIGLGSPIGIAGGLFHMFNNALYKSGLFLTSGAVNKQTKENKLENLGGLAPVMPITFFCTVIFALSISGVPPFNGFVSKWIIYQGIIDLGKGSSLASKLWVVWLGAAVLGSALTLASFIKLIGGIYLGRVKEQFKKIKEVNILMWLPTAIIALLCIGFGIWGSSVIIPKLIIPITGEFEYLGLWESELVGILIIAGILLGVILYFLGTARNLKRKRHFVGGELMSKHKDLQYPSVEFYKTIEKFKFFNWFYKKAERKYFDIYDLNKKIVLFINRIFSKAHTGILSQYILWVLIGLAIILFILV